MVLMADRHRVKTLLTETITLLCKNGLHFKSQFSVEALIGITLDNDDVFLVSIKETVKAETTGHYPTDCSDVGYLELCSRNTVESNVTSEQHIPIASPCMSGPIVDDFEKVLPGDETYKNDKEQRTVNEKFTESPQNAEHSRVRPRVKRRFSESHSADMKAGDSADSAFACNSLKRSSAEAAKKEPVIKRLYDNSVGSEIEDNVMDHNRTESLRTGSCEVVDFKVEPNSDDDDVDDDDGPSFRSNDCTIDSADMLPISCPQPTFSEHASYLTWNGYTHFGQQDLMTSVKSNSSLASSIDELNRTGHHSGQTRPHRCSKCDKSFTTVQGRNLHEKLHDGIYQYTCPHCGKGCSGTTQLRGHMATHTQVKEFKCPICGQAYVYKKTLTDHIKRLHMDILSMPIM